MSTRAVIARSTKDGFTGRYHHWDGYPEGLGATLFNLFNGHFKGDLNAMLKFLLDEHKAGWSTINGRDFALPAGFDASGPQCYCHGARSESPGSLTHKTASASGCEWAYVFSVRDTLPTMAVYSAYHRDGNKAIGMFSCGDPKATWRLCALVTLTDPQPDWKTITSDGQVIQRPVINFV